MTNETQDKKPREKTAGECPKCGGGAAFVKDVRRIDDGPKRRVIGGQMIVTTGERGEATLQCQNPSCEKEWTVPWPMK